MTLKNYEALSVNGVIRAFSFFTSSAEYTQFISLGIVLLWVARQRGHHSALLPVPILLVGLFLESARGAIFSTMAACAMIWAVQSRTVSNWWPRLALAGVLAIIGMITSVQQVQEMSVSSQTAGLVEHESSGLLNPLDKEKSTAPDHALMVVSGITRGFMNPVGLGLGATTIAGWKFNGDVENSEMDISNLFTSLGFVGGLVYVVIVALILKSAFNFWIKSRSHAALVMLALMLLLFGQWLNGQCYATSMMVWFFVGTLDRMQNPGRRI